jgi:hypothetical protein
LSEHPVTDADIAISRVRHLLVDLVHRARDLAHTAGEVHTSADEAVDGTTPEDVELLDLLVEGGRRFRYDPREAQVRADALDLVDSDEEVLLIPREARIPLDSPLQLGAAVLVGCPDDRRPTDVRQCRDWAAIVLPVIHFLGGERSLLLREVKRALLHHRTAKRANQLTPVWILDQVLATALGARAGILAILAGQCLFSKHFQG